MGKKFLIVLLLILAAAGFGILKLVNAYKKAGQLGDAAVEHYHSQFNARADAEIYQNAGRPFKMATTEAQFGAEWNRLHGGLGAFKSGTRQGLSMNNDNGDKRITLTYASTYEKGVADEVFIFDYNGDLPVLIGVNVKSPVFNQ